MKSIRISSKALVLATLIAVAGCGGISSREDFEAQVKDKSVAEVQKKIGKPASVDESVPGTVRWTYNGKTFHTDGGTKFDKKTIVVFQKADAATPPRMVEVKYE